MTQLAIKGHPTRGKEVIQLLEMLGGKNTFHRVGTEYGLVCYIDDKNNIFQMQINDYNPCSNYTIFTLEEFEKKFPYKVGDIVKCHAVWKGIIESMEWYEGEVVYHVRSYSDDYLTSVTAKHLHPYKEETNMKTDCKKCGLQYGSVRCFDMDYCPNNQPKSNAVGLKDGKVIECGVNMKDNKATGSRIDFSLTERIELELGDTHEVVVENGKTYVVKKKPQYPKDYEECCEVLGISRHDVEIDLPHPYQQKMFNLFKLHICRDAYWKIAGEQMGLSKPWESDFTNNDEERYGIYTLANKVVKDFCGVGDVNMILVFPAEEMRDAFFENFKDLINDCKELL